MSANMETFTRLRASHPLFIYEDYSYRFAEDGLHVQFDFSVGDDLRFRPTLFFPSRSFYKESLDADQLDLLCFHCGMIELISYWKCTCSPRVEVRPAVLSAEQVAWWKKLYFKGLGEFFYVNNIATDGDAFMDLSGAGSRIFSPQSFSLREEVMVPIGGGKDSVVSLELLRASGLAMRPMIINPRGATLQCASVAGFEREQVVEIQRSIDPRLLALNAEGYLNGHTPFSAMLAFVSLLASALTGMRHIALSNESSANESTVQGEEVNHQYSKSLEFEEDFRSYTSRWISSDFNYFSFLRGLNELGIARQFAGYTAYHEVFRSCNVGSKEDVWCGHCAKCLFAYIILSPFLPPERLTALFGRDLLDAADLENEFDQLVGQLPVKPFECVGTVEEVQVAMNMHIRNYPDHKPYLVRYFETLPVYSSSVKDISRQRETPHCITSYFMQFYPCFDREDHVLLLGFGREGRASYRRFRSLYPALEITLADRNEAIAQEPDLLGDRHLHFQLGEGYMNFDERYTQIVQSPGVSLKDHPGLWSDERLTSQTDLFLAKYGPQIIGITGTKGKSTTSSLIYHILKKAGEDVILVGNIGVPPFDKESEIGPGTRIVFELSSHQLESCRHSPHIAVLLNIFQEHLDHYVSYEAYQQAKLNITRYQQPSDLLVINADEELLQDLYQGLQIRRELGPFSLHTAFMPGAYIDGGAIYVDGEFFLSCSDIVHLRGEHNWMNVMAAILVCRRLFISDDKIREGICDFESLPHRLEYVGTYSGILFYNDSISTIPEATLAALKALDGVQTLILGGFDRGIDYTALVDHLMVDPVENIIFVGEAGQRIRNTWIHEIIEQAQWQGQTQFFDAKDYEEVVALAFRWTDAGRLCLLSPAASSYDMFTNFEHRGSVFAEKIVQYGKRER